MELTIETLEQHWLPFTANREFKREPRLFVAPAACTTGASTAARSWTAARDCSRRAAGHCRPEIADAVERAAADARLHAVLHARPSRRIRARRTAVAALTPKDLDHIFFCNSGSEAVDTAIKIALAYHLARKEAQRTYFVSRERAYHGVNIGGTALSGMVKNREAFGALMPGVLHLRHTLLPENRMTRGMGASGAELADDLLRFVQLVGEKRIAAVFVEPIAGSTGVLVPPRGYLERIREICDRYGILLVFDEVICGFGRTGEPFAAELLRRDARPDHHGEGAHQRRAADGRGRGARQHLPHDHRRGAGRRAGVLPRLHLLGASGRLRRGPRDARRSTRPSGCSPGAANCRPISWTRCSRCRICRRSRMCAATACWRASRSSRAGAPGMRGTELQAKLFDRGLHVKTTGDVAIMAPAFIASRAEIDQMAALLREALAEY